MIGALALIVVGPKDLPGLLRSIGQWVGKIKGMAREFQRSMDDAARQADLSQFKDLRDLKSDIGKSLDFKEQASKAQSFLNSDAKDDEPKVEAPKAEVVKAEAPKVDVPAETPKVTPTPADPPKAEAKAAEQ